MNNISGFLQKFFALDNKNKAKLSLVLDVIKNKTGLLIQKENLEIKDEILKIKANPVIRNEIFIHKEEIELSLKENNVFLRIL